jgi:uncharacterized membrane protein YeaQ/YmgE (transglycosylase-associated protein family)
MNLLVQLLIGAVAGWLGSEIFKGRSFGLIGNILLGIVGSIVGSWILAQTHTSLGAGWLGLILTGALGAIVILAVANLLFGGK